MRITFRSESFQLQDQFFDVDRYLPQFGGQHDTAKDCPVRITIKHIPVEVVASKEVDGIGEDNEFGGGFWKDIVHQFEHVIHSSKLQVPLVLFGEGLA